MQATGSPVDMDAVMRAAERIRQWEANPQGDIVSLFAYTTDRNIVADFAMRILPSGGRPVAMTGDCAGFTGAADDGDLTASLATRKGDCVEGTLEGINYLGEPMGYASYNGDEELFCTERDAKTAAYLSRLDELIELRQKLEPTF